MAREIQLQTSPDLVVKAVIRNAAGLVWQTTSKTFVEFADADMDGYGVLLAEQGDSSGYYVGDFPVDITQVGVYALVAYKQAGESLVASDAVVGTGNLTWTGSHEEQNPPPPSSSDLPVYASVAGADALAEQVPGLAAWGAASEAQKLAALRQATKDIDAAGPYQGRKYDPTQTLAFPRLAYGELSVASYPLAVTSGLAGGGAVVWDWDASENAAVVPQDVLLATLYQADSILAGDREERLDARHDGVASQSADGLSESFAGEAPVLCRRAHRLMEQYRLRSGELL